MVEIENPQLPLNKEQTEAERTIRDLEIYALVRTAFSSERSLLAWMRTSVSLYTFGFSITKFFDYLEQQEAGTQFSEGSQLLGFALVFLGILALVPAIPEHIQRLRKMKNLGLPRVSRFSLPVAATVALLSIGITILFF